jgi:hypothetical protein
MVLPGVYTKEEQKMLEKWEVREQEVGWLGDDPVPGKISHPVSNRVATKALILNRAEAIHDRNPLWRDEKYARQTRWGSISMPGKPGGAPLSPRHFSSWLLVFKGQSTSGRYLLK